MSKRIAVILVSMMIGMVSIIITAYAAYGVLHTQWSGGLVKGDYQEETVPSEESSDSVPQEWMGDVIISEPIRIIDLLSEIEELDEDIIVTDTDEETKQSVYEME